MTDVSERPLTIAIDGPAGAGKSTIARLVADRLGYLHIDTGAMYRALALKAFRLGTDIQDNDALTEMANQTSVELKRLPDGSTQVLLDGEDVTGEIRRPDVTRIVSRVSSPPGLRFRMVHMQREIARSGGVVMDGRDIGSVVLPDADRKLFVTASLEERARRRYRELVKAGVSVDFEALRQEIAERDEADKRKEGSLVQTPDMIYIDTTGRSIDEVVSLILSYCRRG